MRRRVHDRASLPVADGALARGLLALAMLLACLLLVAAPAAAALKAIDVNNEPIGSRSPRSARSTSRAATPCSIETAPGSRRRHAAHVRAGASTPGTNPAWFVFALTNATDKPIERWLAADRYSTVGLGRGVARPRRAAHRASRLRSAMCPSASRTIAPTCSASRWSPARPSPSSPSSSSDRFARLYLWKAIEYEQKSRDRQLFNGIMLGITGLLAIFLTAVFAANHKAIFPTAAIFTWCVLAYLCVDFGFWHKLFNIRPEENAQYRAAAEAAMAASLLVFLYIFLRLGAWHGFVRMLLALWIAAQLVLVAVAFLDPRLAATFARLSSIAIAGGGAALTLFLALRGQDRALSLVPTWMLLLVWLFGAGATFIGRLAGDFVVFGLTVGPRADRRADRLHRHAVRVPLDRAAVWRAAGRAAAAVAGRRRRRRRASGNGTRAATRSR